MARKSRKNFDTTAIEEASVPVQYNAAAYVRLSSDDKRKHGDSLEIQRNIIENYVATAPDIKIAEVYSDNNATGTNFDRPGFQRMLADAHSGKINCIIVKDLSRFGRNAIDGGYYIEKLLPSIGIRFIAITDSFDSNEPDSGIMLPLRQIINESYALDISRKRRAVQVQQIAEGIHVGRLAPYGYMKAPGDCHRLVINEETAPTVRRIFGWALSGAGANNIARRLSEEGVPTPAAYNYSKGYDKTRTQLSIPYWKVTTINGILSDRMYVGDMTQGKSRKVNGKTIKLPQSEWVIVPNTHEPIVSIKDFEKVQAMRQNARDKAMSLKITPFEPSVFAGKVFCAHCGRPMKHKRQNKDGSYWFRCESQSRYGKDSCCIVSVKEDALRDETLSRLKSQTADVLGKYIALEKESTGASDPCDGLEKELREINRELGSASRFHKSLYESLVDGLITPEEHALMKSDYEAKIEALSCRADEIRSSKNKLEKDRADLFGVADAVSLAVSEKKLTAGIVDATVEKILVRKGMKFDIAYKFDNNEKGAV